MRIFAFLIFLLCTPSCIKKSNVNTDELIATYGLAGPASPNNYAVLVGAPNGLQGVATDIKEMKKVFENEKYDFRFTPAVNGNAKASEIVELTAKSAQNSDSLLFYFSGHGNDGVLLADDRTFTFREVADAIKISRKQKPLKRLVVLLDSCLSGSFVDGESPVVDSYGKKVRMKKINANIWYNQMFDQITTQAVDGTLYEEVFIFASSKKDENSSDLGKERGGAFTYSFRSEIEKLASTQYDTAKVKNLPPGVIRQTENLGGHTPVYRAYPEQEVLEDWLFKHRL